jgi:hypothetical protein
VRRGGEEAAALLRRIPGVDTATAAASELRVEWSQGRDLRDEVVRLVAEKGLGLQEMRPSGMNIEELYLKIVSGGLGQ